MDGLNAGWFVERRGRLIPGAHFGDTPGPARALDPGMGVAVGRRTIFRDSDQASFGNVADRVAAGNMALLGRTPTRADRLEQMRLRNAIATGALMTSGRHLQHGDLDQPSRNMEVFTNCATAITSFAKFYLLLNGSGVGRSYDDELVVVDWAARLPCCSIFRRTMPIIRTIPSAVPLGRELGLLGWDASQRAPIWHRCVTICATI